MSTRKISESTNDLYQTDQQQQAPRTADDSTSALAYKEQQRSRPPPLPATDLPRARSAEEAVTNILYNTPPPSLQPYKKHVLNCLVQNEPGVLSRVSGILAGRGFNIESLVVCRTEIRDLSRMCIVLNGQDGVVEQARRQLEDLVPVWPELLLAKVSILGPEYLEDQLVGGPSHEPRHGSSAVLPAQWTTTSQNSPLGSFRSQRRPPPRPHPSEALRIKHQHLSHIRNLAAQFNANIVDVSENSVIVEMSAKSSRVEAFLTLLKPFGIIESARTGAMVMPRTPLPRSLEDDDAVEFGEAVDASLLPPG
ncbi:hypothetical protein BS47DRAFT_1371630 [Hydnum rufescens UP504]|uniref:ACT domain-containing protein n=1 Tax=Hydnum rufescens UP504 TaxID=1448309 RepID=A0A9P6B3E0_9AGAM|nr:hypothetical protein BS47DRAFT_1371630 [Hydnum rufescens UP504]